MPELVLVRGKARFYSTSMSHVFCSKNQRIQVTKPPAPPVEPRVVPKPKVPLMMKSGMGAGSNSPFDVFAGLFKSR